MDLGLVELMGKLGSEDNFASRLEAEMQTKGLSQAKLAKRMEEVGHPLHQSAISKILNPPQGTTRRSVSIDEALAFSRALEVPLPALLVPNYALELGQASELLMEVFELYKSSLLNEERLKRKLTELVDVARSNDQARALIENTVASAVKEIHGDDEEFNPDSMTQSFFMVLQNRLKEDGSDG